MIIRETFSLNQKSDADIIAWLGRQRNKSAAIRDACRAAASYCDVTNADLLRAIERLERCGVAVAAQREQAVDDEPEPAEVVLALDMLGR